MFLNFLWVLIWVMCGQSCKKFTVVTYTRRNINRPVLQTPNGRMRAVLAKVYFVTAVSYTCKWFTALAPGVLIFVRPISRGNRVCCQLKPPFDILIQNLHIFQKKNFFSNKNLDFPVARY